MLATGAWHWPAGVDDAGFSVPGTAQPLVRKTLQASDLRAREGTVSGPRGLLDRGYRPP